MSVTPRVLDPLRRSVDDREAPHPLTAPRGLTTPRAPAPRTLAARRAPRAHAARRALTLRALAASLVLASALVLAGCGCGKESGDPIPYLGGNTTAQEYESSPQVGPWLHFPGGRRYQLVHELGAAPTRFEAYLSFEPTDIANFTTSSGNAGLFERVTAEYVQIRNDTCADFYVRVVASIPDSPTP